MKRCPQCNRLETDETLKFCRVDGATLVTESPATRNETGTSQRGTSPDEVRTSILPHSTQAKVNRLTDPTRALPESVSGNTQQLAKPKRRKPIVVVAIVAACVLGLALVVVVAATLVYLNVKKPAAPAITSIAVMPFVNESGNSDVEYLSDGMTESLISSLSHLPNLSVKARSSVFRYKGKETNPQTIAKELNVQAILNGRIAQRGDQLTLTVELVEAQTEIVIWSEQYNRPDAELVSLQSVIARDVSTKLRTKLSGAEIAKVGKTSTADPEAYKLYLQGRFYWNKRTGDSLKQAVVFYNRAIERDASFALAYAALAETYALFPGYSIALPKDSMPQTKAAALRALELDDSLAEAHTAFAFYLDTMEWDRTGAEREYRRALELNPNYASAHHWLGESLATRKRFDEALTALRLAQELDPLSPIITSNIGWTLLYARRYDEAVNELRRLISRDPGFAYAHLSLAQVYHAKGLYAEAIAELQRANELSYDPINKAYIALALAKSGDRVRANTLLEELKKERSERYVPAHALALVYLGLDNKEEALSWLEKEVNERGYWANFYAVDPEVDKVRSDSRFKDLLKRLNLPN